MKKISIIIVLFFIISTNTIIFAEEETSDKENITKISISRPLINESGKFSQIDSIQTNGFLSTPGKPLIPILKQTFTYPINTKIEKITIKPSSSSTIQLTKLIKPTPEMSISDSKIKKSIDELNYGNSTYPSPHYSYTIARGIDGNNPVLIVNIELYPYRYNPLDNSVSYIENFEINIQTKQYENQVNTLSSEEQYSMIILTPTLFKSELEPLEYHKNSQGLSTKIITLDEIYNGIYFDLKGRDEAEQIKYFIKNAYDQWSTTYVLLVGGNNELPIRKTHVAMHHSVHNDAPFASDLYYADIVNESNSFSSWDSNGNNLFGEYDWEGKTDKIDLYPDVHLGRLPCVDESEVEICVDKIISYETNQAYTSNWFTSFVNIGGDSAPGDEESISEGEYACQQAAHVMDGFIPVNIFASNGDLNSKKEINNALNNGAGFVYFSGHGHLRLWSTHPHEMENIWLPPGNYDSQDLQMLINADKLPIVIADACYIGQFDRAQDCFSWSFITNPNGGSIATFSSTESSIFYLTSYVTQGLIGKMAQDTFKAYNHDGAITLGEMWSRALHRYINSRMDAEDYFTVEEWHLFGDPSLKIADESIPPEKPTLTGPATGKTGEEIVFTASTSDSNNDEIYYLFQWNEFEYSDWIGPYDSGESAEITHIFAEEGEYEIRVKAKDDHGVQSEWSDLLPISMPKPKARLNQRMITWFNQIIEFFENFKPTRYHINEDCGCAKGEILFPYNVISQQSIIDKNQLKSIKENHNTYPFATTIAANDLPTYFNWKDMNGKDFTTPAKIQANCGSCWDFAGLGAIEAVIKIRENDSSLNPDLSEQYVLSCLPDAANNFAEGCLGGQPVNAFRCILSDSEDGNSCNGVIWENCFDYQASHDVDCSEKCEDWFDYLVPISDYGMFYNEGVLQNTEQSRNNIKNALMQHGPVGSFMDVTDSFIRWGERNHDPTDYCPYEERTFNNHLNHAILIVGWKDDPTISNGGYWICKNSWGKDWGYDGFYNIEYGTHFTGFRIDWVDYVPTSYNWEHYNDRPYKPTIEGPSNGRVETEQTFTAKTTDPNNEQLFYLFEWDDGTGSDWLGPFDSNKACDATHVWSEKGDYEVRVKAKNINGLMSEFSDPIPVKMPHEHPLLSYRYSYVLFSNFLELIKEDCDL